MGLTEWSHKDKGIWLIYSWINVTLKNLFLM